MYRSLRGLFSDRRGVTAIEYGLICVLLALATLATLQSFGTSLNTGFNTVATSVSAAGG